LNEKFQKISAKHGPKLRAHARQEFSRAFCFALKVHTGPYRPKIKPSMDKKFTRYAEQVAKIA
jgi:hypothetical protein